MISQSKSDECIIEKNLETFKSEVMSRILNNCKIERSAHKGIHQNDIEMVDNLVKASLSIIQRIDDMFLFFNCPHSILKKLREKITKL